MKRKGIIIAVTVFLLLMTPFAVKAATDGEVDLYAMIFNLETRVDEVEAENKELQDRVAELEGATQEPDTETTSETTTETITEEPTQEPTQEPAPAKTTEPTTTTTDTTTTTTEPEPVVEPEPIIEPEPVNPYADVTLSGVHVATYSSVAVFGKWSVNIGVAEVDPSAMPGILIGSAVICFTDQEKEMTESKLANMGIPFTTSAIPIDTLLYEIVAGKTFGSRTEAINYIESKIAE